MDEVQDSGCGAEQSGMPFNGTAGVGADLNPVSGFVSGGMTHRGGGAFGDVI